MEFTNEDLFNKYVKKLKDTFNVSLESLKINKINDSHFTFVIEGVLVTAMKKLVKGLSLEQGYLSEILLTESEDIYERIDHLNKNLIYYFNVIGELPLIFCYRKFYYNVFNKKEYFYSLHRLNNKNEYPTNILKFDYIIFTNIPELENYHNTTIYDENLDSFTIIHMEKENSFVNKIEEISKEIYFKKNKNKNNIDFEVKKIEFY